MKVIEIACKKLIESAHVDTLPGNQGLQNTPHARRRILYWF